MDRAFEIVGAIACEEDQRHMGLDDLDRLDYVPEEDALLRKIDDIA